MKKLTIAFLAATTLINAAPPQGESNLATGGLSTVAPMIFSCLCAGQLQSAFQSIKAHVITDNLTPIKTSLQSLNENIQNNIEALNAAQPLIQKSNDIYVEKIVEAKKILFRLEQQTREEASSVN